MRNQNRRRGTMRNQIRRRDLVSEFPDELLLKILSFLPSKDVVATSAISKRWKSLWKEIKTFRNDDTPPYPLTFQMFALFVRSRSSVESLQLKLNPNYSRRLINPLSRPEGVHGFVINAPSLTCFSIKDSYSNYLRFGNMPELVKASVNIVCDQPEDILGSLVSTRYLSLCLHSPYLPLATSFLFLDHLELYSCTSQWCNLLKDAPKLRVLKLYLRQYSQYNETAASWNQPNSIPECLSSHLEIFEWRHYNGTDQEREAAKYILANASCLKKATFYSKSAMKHDMLKELECVARGSNACMLVFE
ncbi:hypothetical protein N665_0211s0001 [Sinapis alba]|nr:hypothetical protein N665_0211s0001 [Sinapis alba]